MYLVMTASSGQKRAIKGSWATLIGRLNSIGLRLERQGFLLSRRVISDNLRVSYVKWGAGLTTIDLELGDTLPNFTRDSIDLEVLHEA